MKYFVVATDPMTPDDEKTFRASLSESVAWWHWLPNFWLLRSRDDDLDAKGIRDTLRRTAGEIRCMVLEVDPITWAAMTKKNAKGKSMTEWLGKHWSRGAD